MLASVSSCFFFLFPCVSSILVDFQRCFCLSSLFCFVLFFFGLSGWCVFFFFCWWCWNKRQQQTFVDFYCAFRCEERMSHLFKPKGVLSLFCIVCRHWSPGNVTVTKIMMHACRQIHWHAHKPTHQLLHLCTILLTECQGTKKFCYCMYVCYIWICTFEHTHEQIW